MCKKEKFVQLFKNPETKKKIFQEVFLQRKKSRVL